LPRRVFIDHTVQGNREEARRVSQLRIHDEPPICFVQLDAGKRNVLTLATVCELRDVIRSGTDLSVLVLSGRDDGFCCGLDNGALASEPSAAFSHRLPPRGFRWSSRSEHRAVGVA